MVDYSSCGEVHEKYTKLFQELLENYDHEFRIARGILAVSTVYLVPDWFVAIGVRKVDASMQGQFGMHWMSSDSPVYTVRGLVEAAMKTINHYPVQLEYSELDGYWWVTWQATPGDYRCHSAKTYEPALRFARLLLLKMEIGDD